VYTMKPSERGSKGREAELIYLAIRPMHIVLLNY
jgi:hypothetical protein